VTKTLQDILNQPLSAQTVRNNLKATGMKAVVKKKQPILTKRHRKDRLDFALSHKDWTLEDWKKVVWSDETKINRMGSDGRKWVWKKAGEALSDRLVEGTKKFGGGSVMVWGCMMWDGIGYACKIDGRMDGDLYVKILDEEVQDSIEYMAKPTAISYFSKTTTPNTSARRPQSGLKIMGMMSCYGLPSLQT
jgi:hypothetical protein